jgi:hypothetical protein
MGFQIRFSRLSHPRNLTNKQDIIRKISIMSSREAMKLCKQTIMKKHC